MISSAGPMVKLVLLLLLFLSILSWALIIFKLRLLGRIEKANSAFYDFFWRTNDVDKIFAGAKNHPAAPLTRLFLSAYPELKLAAEGSITAVKTGFLSRTLKKNSENERGGLEKSISFLATTGSTAPFIGLFGTVWGIMNTFSSIGAKGSANLAVVAPGIAEALIATAMGLIAAIPAVIGYNNIVARIERVTNDMEAFSADVINLAEAGATRVIAGETEQKDV